MTASRKASTKILPRYVYTWCKLRLWAVTKLARTLADVECRGIREAASANRQRQSAKRVIMTCSSGFANRRKCYLRWWGNGGDRTVSGHEDADRGKKQTNKKKQQKREQFSETLTSLWKLRRFCWPYVYTLNAVPPVKWCIFRKIKIQCETRAHVMSDIPGGSFE